ncbi:MAG: hypothetical protein HQL31_12545 [Planctomycetes bacterium]|nr:hypothetical protein [Planctomycetota bacterium]
MPGNSLMICGFALAVLAGILAGTCAAPIKLMRHYRFEHWAFIAAWVGQLLLPWLVMLALCPEAWAALGTVDPVTIVKANLFSLAWGIANILCGLCLVRIGFSLSVGLLTGIGLPIGVLLPMIFRGTGQFADAPGLGTPSGRLILCGVGIMIIAVVWVTKAGFGREAALGEGSVPKGGFRSGLLMISVAGILQVGLSFAFVYSQGPICAALMARGASSFSAGLGVWALTLPGGALINLAYPAWLLTRRRSWGVFKSAPQEMLLSAMMGCMFFLFIMSMGTGMLWLGGLGASVGFGVYQAAQISASQAVGFLRGEWHGVPGPSHRQMKRAVALLLLAVVVIATGRAAG